MSTKVQKVKQNSIVETAINEFTKGYALVIPDDIVLSFHDYEQLAVAFSELNIATNFWVGDLLNRAERTEGEAYAQLIEYIQWKKDRISQAKWVAGKVPPANRVEGMSFTHHRLVASYPKEEQRYLLLLAQTEDWSTAQFDAYLSGKMLLETPLKFSTKDAKRVTPIVDRTTWHRVAAMLAADEPGVHKIPFRDGHKDRRFVIDTVTHSLYVEEAI